MTTVSLCDSKTSDSPREKLYNDKWLFERERLEKIARVFDVSEEKIQRLNNDWDLQNKCFKKVVRTCESESWEKINPIKKLIFGIKDARGQTVYDVLTNQDAPPNFCVHPPENLVFQGGGPKGIAYIGVLKALEEQRNIIPTVKRVAGTSAGAIIATLIAMGYTTSEIQKFLISKEITDFLDKPFSNWGGICKGDEFLNWINQLIEQKTGVPNCTFGELRREIKKGRNFKHLHVLATKVGPNKDMFQFCSEDKKWDSLVIADAVRASMSLPIAFPPHTLHFKNTENQSRCPREDYGSFMDGGLSGDLFNFPIQAFDKKRYIMPFLSEVDGDLEITNKKTLAFSLYTPGEEVPESDTPITGIVAAYNQWGESEKDAIKIYRKTKKIDPYRVIKISNCRVKTHDFRLSDQKKQELINSGRASTRAFFRDQQERLHRLSALEEKIYQRKSTTFFYKLYRSRESVLGVEIIGNNVSFHANYSYSCSCLPNPFRDSFSFTNLAQFDERFLLFTHLRTNNLDQADTIYYNNQIFFKNCFSWDIFRKLLIERNCPEYLYFFMNKKFSFASETFHPIWCAYKCESFKALEALLKDTSVDLRVLEPETGKTLLYYFAKEGQYDLVQLFCAAFKERYPKSYRALLDHEVNSNQFNRTTQAPQLKTALIIAAEKNNHQVVDFLIEAGADFRKRVDGLSPLDYAPTSILRNQSKQILQQARYGNITRELEPWEKLNALSVCCSYYCSYSQLESAQRLIRNKIFPFGHDRDDNGNGLLLIVMKSTALSWAEKRILIGMLLRRNDDVNQANTQEITPLILAAQYDLETMQLLLTIPSLVVNHQDIQKNTALHYAVSKNRPKTTEGILLSILANPNRPKMTEMLLARQANPNLQNGEGQTPLHLTNNIEIITTLMKKGANPLLRNGIGKTPREQAELSGNTELVQFLKQCEKSFNNEM